MTPLKHFTFRHFSMQLFAGIGGGIIAPPIPPVIPGGGGGSSGAFDTAKYRIKKPEIELEPEIEEVLVCIRAHHVGAQWGMLVANVSRSPKPTKQQQMIVALFIAQHGNT